MKFIKKYENKSDELWYVSNVSTLTPTINELYLFDDEESAKNYFIYEVNEAIIESKGENKIYVSSVEEADDAEYDTCVIEWGKIRKMEKFELPEDFKITNNSKKYNL